MNKLLIFLVILFSIPSILSLARPGYFPMHDDMQAMRVLQMDKCVKDLQIPCRWVPDMGYGYGYPQFNFYSPLPYYVMEAFHLVGFGILDSVKIGFAITVFISAIGMYLLGEKVWGKWGGVLSSVIFVYSPYRAVDMYVRGAVGEFWALSFLPFVFWSILILNEKQKYSKVYFALSLSALFLSHNVTTLIALPFIALFIFILSLKDYLNERNSKQILNFYVSSFVSSLVGFGLSAFFLLPAFFEKQYAHVESLVGGYFDYRIHFVSIQQLLLSNFWGYGGSESGPMDEMFLGVGLIPWVLAFVTVGVLVLRKKYKLLVPAGYFLFLAVVSLFMVHAKSTFIWERLSFLEIIQFPWRFLVLSTFAFSLLAGGVITLVENKKAVFTGVVIFVSVFYLSFFRPKSWLDITDQQKFEGENWRLAQTISIFDYLPIYSEFPPAERAPEPSYPNFKKTSNSMSFDISLAEKQTISLPLFYFPGWKVYVNDQEKEVRYDNELGLITFDLEPGDYKVLAKFEDTPIRTFGNILSLFSIFGVVWYTVKKKHENITK